MILFGLRAIVLEACIYCPDGMTIWPPIAALANQWIGEFLTYRKEKLSLDSLYLLY